MSLDNYRETNRRIFAHRPEEFEKLYDEKQLATQLQKEEAKLGISIPEQSLEEHITAIWGVADDEYHDFVEDWQKQKTFIELPDGNKAHLLDTNDFVEMNRSDTAFFYMVDGCFAVVIDVDCKEGNKKRVAYHMPGIYVDKELALEVLLKKLEADGKVVNVVVLSNSERGYGKVNMGEYKHFIDKYPHNFVDMDEVDPWGSHDVFVRGDTARIYHSSGDFDLGTEERTVVRVFGGEVGLTM